MNNKNHRKTTSLATSLVASLLAVSSTQAANIVYQDTFGDGALATNPGIGGGLSHNPAGGGSWGESGGSIASDNSVNNMRSIVFTSQAYDLSDGFTLEVTYNTSHIVGPDNASRFAVGILETGFAGTAAYDDDNFLTSNDPGESFGLNITESNSVTTGLYHNDPLPAESLGVQLSNAQTLIAGVDQTVSMTVDAAGNYFYSIDGALATTGTTTLDLSKSYEFAAFYQDQLAAFAVREVTLTALDPIPEPSSTALLGLGALALTLRRRK